MEVAREILLMLIRRARLGKRNRKKVEPELLQYMDGQLDEAATAAEIARTIYHASRGGAPQLEAERKRVISISDKREEFVSLSDGYVHFWPQGSPNGALSAWHLRVLADELDRRNRLWDAQLRKAFGGLDS